MKKIIKISILICLLLASMACTSLKMDKPYEGAWRIQKQGNGSVVIPTYFLLKQDSETLAGQVIINNAVEIPIEDVILTDTMASFTIFWGAKYTLYPHKGELRVLVSWNGSAPSEMIAEQVLTEEVSPPENIPLPPIKNVPANGLALTPPMGWNSWNYFETEINDSIVREIADAMIESGMAHAGYSYIVIDDGWEGGRDEEGNIYPNEKFPNMKALADYVHSKGLKLGIYSSPGPRTCGGYIGSYGFEEKDAKTFAEWGIDYLKYDWCGAMRIYGYHRDSMQASYQKMGRALLNSGRDIVYSICQYGLENVWEWGESAGGNLWRTTGDINDTWEKIEEIGFSQNPLAPYAGPGHWNDPDMLEVGNGNLTLDENRSHFTLWCMLAAPLMAGNDLRNMSEETLDILTNKSLIAINQDPLGKQGVRVHKADSVEVWVKPLADGSKAIAFFNRNSSAKEVNYSMKTLGINKVPENITDVWEQKKLAVKNNKLYAIIERHGVLLLKVK